MPLHDRRNHIRWTLRGFRYKCQETKSKAFYTQLRKSGGSKILLVYWKDVILLLADIYIRMLKTLNVCMKDRNPRASIGQTYFNCFVCFFLAQHSVMAKTFQFVCVLFWCLDAMKRERSERAWFWCEEGTTPLAILEWEVAVFKTNTTRMRRMIVIPFPSSWLYYHLHLCS